MPKFLFETTYTSEGIRALQKDKGSARKQAVEKLVASLDGKLEAFYYASTERARGASHRRQPVVNGPPQG